MILEYNHISKAAKEAVQYIEDRRTGKIKPLKTSFKKLNDSIDGFN